MEKREHDIEYDDFMKKYKRGETDGEEVGAVIAKLAQYFASTNLKMVEKKILLNKVELKNVTSFDDATGKQISVAKANVMTSNSPESNDYKKEEAHLKNIEVYINSLKNLQKGILTEYSHMGGN